MESYRVGGLGALNITFLCALNQPFLVIYGSWAPQQQLGAALSSPSESHFCCVGLYLDATADSSSLLNGVMKV